MFSLIQTIQLPCHEHAQRKNLDLIEAANESRVVINVLQEERHDDIVWDPVWDELFETAKEMTAEWNIMIRE